MNEFFSELSEKLLLEFLKPELLDTWMKTDEAHHALVTDVFVILNIMNTLINTAVL